MRLLLDECVPRPLKLDLIEHDVRHVSDMGWSSKRNGELLKLMLAEQFDALITVDQNLEFQQNLRASGVGVVVLLAKTNRLKELRRLKALLLDALMRLRPGDFDQGWFVTRRRTCLQGSSDTCRSPRTLGNNLGTDTPEYRVTLGSRADQKAGRINKISFPALSAKPPSPVQIRAAPPNSLVNSLVWLNSAASRDFLLLRTALESAPRSKSDLCKSLHRDDLSARDRRREGVRRTSTNLSASKLPELSLRLGPSL